MPLHREESVSAGTKSIAPVTINKLPVYVAGIPTPTIKDSIFAQSADAHTILVGVNASVNAGQVANKPAYVIGEGATAWGDGAIAIGSGVTAGQTAAKDGGVVIGNGVTGNAKNVVRIGSALAFGVGAGDDAVGIGTQVTIVGNAAIAIGRGAAANVNGVAIGNGASTNGTTEGVAIGTGAACANTGVNHFGIAIGNGASAGTNNGQSAIAIGKGATATHALASKLIAIGEGAVINTNVTQAIAIGAGATNPGSNELLFGDSANGNHIKIVTVRSLAANPVRHRVGASGGWAVRDAGDANDIFLVDSDATANNTRLQVWDVTAAALRRVSIGAANSGGAGFRQLIIPN